MGGIDTINVGDGNMVAFGGYGGDTIIGGHGTNSILVGDNGAATFNAAGVVTEVKTTDIDLTGATGGNDTISNLSGTTVAIGGVGADSITLGNTAGGNSVSVVLGDDGTVDFNPAGSLLSSVSTNLDMGGVDTINVGDGNMVAFGGYGSDTINGGIGTNSILVGDNGFATFNAAGVVTNVTTSDTTLATGGDDIIHTVSGTTIAIGGVGRDTITLGDTSTGGTSVVLGDNGTVQFNAAGTIATNISTNLDLGDVDTITVGNGTMVVFGGFGADTINFGNGNSVFSIFVGDNGTAIYDAAGNPTITTTDTSAATGGDDSIIGGTGNAVAIGGVGNDTITLGNGNAYILGDNGVVDLDPSITSTGFDQGLGGNDNIHTGDGNHAIIGGYGTDSITSGNGTDYVFGDSGTMTLGSAGIVGGISTSEQTLDTTDASGGGDTIVSGNGQKIVFGGPGNDTVTAGSGTHVVFGDEGAVTSTTLGVLQSIVSTNPGLGGGDTIGVGNGDSFILGGAGGDHVTGGTSASNSVMFGDNGSIAFDSAGHIGSVVSTATNIGGDDFLSTGNGNDVLIGGTGNDFLATGGGNSVLLGDSGEVQLVNDRVRFVQTTDLFTGGDDTLQGGSGHNIEMGGFGNNLLYGNLSNDILIGNYAAITIDGNGVLTSLARFAGGGVPDLIAAAQDAMFMVTPNLTAVSVPVITYDNSGDPTQGNTQDQGSSSTTASSDSHNGEEQAAADPQQAGQDGQQSDGQDASPDAKTQPAQPDGQPQQQDPKKKPAATAHGKQAPQVSPTPDAALAAPALVRTHTQAQTRAAHSVEAAKPAAKRGDAVVDAAAVALAGLAVAGAGGKAGALWSFDVSAGAWRAAKKADKRTKRVAFDADESQTSAAVAQRAVAPQPDAEMPVQSSAAETPVLAEVAQPRTRARINWAPAKGR
jgi:Ca2+-binding RTX toxin-like protein